jgi:hypothetical protein
MWDGTGMDKPVIWVGREEEIFFRRGLDRKFSDLPVGPQIAPAAFSFAISSG